MNSSAERSGRKPTSDPTSRSNPIMRYFEFAHLSPTLQAVSKPIGELAVAFDQSMPDSAEKSAGLRKLLEAKDCFVRAALPS